MIEVERQEPFFSLARIKDEPHFKRHGRVVRRPERIALSPIDFADDVIGKESPQNREMMLQASSRWRMVEFLNKKTRVMTSWKSGSCCSKKALHRFIMVKEIVQFFKQGPIGDGSGKKNDSPLVLLKVPRSVYDSRQVPKMGNTVHEIPPIKYNPIGPLYGQASGLSII